MKNLFIPFVLVIFVMGCSKDSNFEIDLSGEWAYQLDSLNKGEVENWFAKSFPKTIQLPGALRDYSIGNEPDLNTKWTGSIYDSSWYFNPAMKKYQKPGNMKFPFWLTPEKHFVGMAWYQKKINIPDYWEGNSIELFLERPHWQTTVWFDSVKIGDFNSLSVPHRFIIPGQFVTKGRHTLSVRVDNAIHELDPGINSHSISDHTQGNWNGIIGDMKVRAVNPTRIESIKITPDLTINSVKISIHLSQGAKASNLDLNIEVEGYDNRDLVTNFSSKWPEGANSFSVALPMGSNYKTWSEFNPNLYKMHVSLVNNTGVLDVKNEVFGMREFTINNKHFEINGIPVFLRGTTECCVFPLTGYPPTNETDWSRIFEICKNHGLNHMRFHSYCPPKAAFSAADKAGFYLQVEGPSWAKYSTALGYGEPIDQYLMDETKRIIDEYGNHPSFVMMAYGNEPSGRYVGYLENWVDHFRKYDQQRVFTGASTGRSWAIIDNSDYIVRSPPRGLKWKDQQPESVFDYRNNTEEQQRPYVTFEMGQWCVFPNFKEIEKYTGSLKAKNFELFQEELELNHMGDQANELLLASGKLQASCYKQEIEATLRTPNLAGFQLLSLNDFSGQGTALVGVLDAFWDEKGYISAKEFSEFCNAVVPLARMNKFTFESVDTLNALIEVANFSGEVLLNPSLTWKLTSCSDDSTVKSGNLNIAHIPIGNCNEVGTIEIPLSFVVKPDKYKLTVKVNEYVNHWNIWVYPKSNVQPNTPDILISHQPDNTIKQALEKGKTVLILANGNIENGKDVVQYQTPVFWNTSWFRMRPPHTTGILIQDKHPVFKNFPTDYYSDMQWWEIGNRQQIMNLENFDEAFRPIVQPIDTWFLNRRLAMLFEANVGDGKIMVCSIDLLSDLENRPVAKHLYNSIVEYMNSADFKPSSTVTFDVIHELFEVKQREGWNSYVNDNP